MSPAATAVPQRSSIMKLQYQTYWTDAAAADDRQSPEQAHLDWINQFYAAVYAEYGGLPDPAEDPGGTVDGCYFNYPDVELGSHERGDVDRALRLYFHDNFRKNPRNLVAIKQLWDPQNYFHHAQSFAGEITLKCREHTRPAAPSRRETAESSPGWDHCRINAL